MTAADIDPFTPAGPFEAALRLDNDGAHWRLSVDNPFAYPTPEVLFPPDRPPSLADRYAALERLGYTQGPEPIWWQWVETQTPPDAPVRLSAHTTVRPSEARR